MIAITVETKIEVNVEIMMEVRYDDNERLSW
jgi:hypothetical protein